MRYAIPVSDGMVSAHFGHCEQFTLIDADEERKEILRKELVTSPGHQPGLLPEWLAEHGVSVVIAGGMGSRAKSLFQQNCIQVVIGRWRATQRRRCWAILMTDWLLGITSATTENRTEENLWQLRSKLEKYHHLLLR